VTPTRRLYPTSSRVPTSGTPGLLDERHHRETGLSSRLSSPASSLLFVELHEIGDERLATSDAGPRPKVVERRELGHYQVSHRVSPYSDRLSLGVGSETVAVGERDRLEAGVNPELCKDGLHVRANSRY